MKEYTELFKTIQMFHNLKLSEILPNVTRSECDMLMLIANDSDENGGVLVSVLTEKMEIKASAVSRILNGLEQQNLVVRTIHPSDRRNVYVSLTEQGEKRLLEIEEVMDAFTENVFGKMPKEDLMKLNQYMIQVYQLSKEELQKMKKQNIKMTRKDNDK